MQTGNNTIITTGQKETKQGSKVKIWQVNTIKIKILLAAQHL